MFRPSDLVLAPSNCLLPTSLSSATHHNQETLFNHLGTADQI